MIKIWNTNIVCVTAIVLSMGTKFVNKEETVSGTRSEDSELRVFPHCECIVSFV